MFPIPSPERSRARKKLTAAPHHVDVDRAAGYVHADAVRRSEEQSKAQHHPNAFAQRVMGEHRHPQGIRAVDPPDRHERGHGLRSVVQPQSAFAQKAASSATHCGSTLSSALTSTSSPSRRSPSPKLQPLSDDQVLARLFPGAQVSLAASRPAVQESQALFAQAPTDYIHDHLLPTAASRRAEGRRQLQEQERRQQARSHSRACDMSIAVHGVRRVDPPLPAAPAGDVPGFGGIGAKTAAARPTGRSRVTPEPWDPLGIVARTGRDPLLLPTK